VVNREKPQFKQTKTLGNTQTPGLSMFLKPQKWIIISVGNSDSLLDAHNKQDMNVHSFRSKGLASDGKQLKNFCPVKIAQWA